MKRRLGIYLAVPPAAWSAQEFAGWYIGSHVCRTITLGTGRMVVLAISVVLLALTAAAGMEGRRLSTGSKFVPTFLAAAFGIGIVWAGVFGALIMRCGETR